MVALLASRLYDDAIRTDLPEFQAWALVYQAEAGDATAPARARAAAVGVDNPNLQLRIGALTGGRPDDR
jgi:hypothetical protein